MIMIDRVSRFMTNTRVENARFKRKLLPLLHYPRRRPRRLERVGLRRSGAMDARIPSISLQGLRVVE